MQNLLAVKCQLDNHFDGCFLQLHEIILTLNSKKITDRLKLFAESSSNQENWFIVSWHLAAIRLIRVKFIFNDTLLLSPLDIVLSDQLFKLSPYWKLLD